MSDSRARGTENRMSAELRNLLKPAPTSEEALKHAHCCIGISGHSVDRLDGSGKITCCSTCHHREGYTFCEQLRTQIQSAAWERHGEYHESSNDAQPSHVARCVSSWNEMHQRISLYKDCLRRT